MIAGPSYQILMHVLAILVSNPNLYVLYLSYLVYRSISNYKGYDLISPNHVTTFLVSHGRGSSCLY